MVTTKKKPGRKSEAERAEIRIQNDKLAKYEEQEAKRAKPIQIDQIPVLVGWLIAVGVAFATSAVISFNGITSVAPLVGLTFDWMAYLFFGFIELLYIVFLVAYLTLASRADEKTLGALAGMWFFAGVSIAANAFHTLEFHNWTLDAPGVAGIILSISAPIAILSVSKLASRLVFAKAISR